MRSDSSAIVIYHANQTCNKDEYEETRHSTQKSFVDCLCFLNFSSRLSAFLPYLSYAGPDTNQQAWIFNSS